MFISQLVDGENSILYNAWSFLEQDLIDLNKAQFKSIDKVYTNIGIEPDLRLPDATDLEGKEGLTFLLSAEELKCSPVSLKEGI